MKNNTFSAILLISSLIFCMAYAMSSAAFADDFIPVVNIDNVPTMTTVGTPLTLTGRVIPENATNKDITWSIKSQQGATGATISDNKLHATVGGTVYVTATIAEGTYGDSIAEIFAGGEHTLALKSDGSLWAWGHNYHGQLGDGTNVDRLTPVQIGISTDWKVVSAGGEHTIALKSGGSLWAWGKNNHGQLGDGTNVDRRMPVQIGTSTDWTAISAGDSHTLALKSDGSLWAWGGNGYGQLGDGTNTDSRIPVRMGIDTDWTAISAGDSHTLALKSDGSLWAWGINSVGELGNGKKGPGENSSDPVRVGTDLNWRAISANGSHSLALKSDGSLWAWGWNGYGQLGDGTTVSRSVPVRVGNDANWAMISIGVRHSLALKSDGSLWAWGDNYYGQLGDGNSGPDEKSTTPVRIETGSIFALISAGNSHSLALKPDGSLWAWGDNYYGQLGDGNIGDGDSRWGIFQARPVQIITDTNTDHFLSPYTKDFVITVNKLEGAAVSGPPTVSGTPTTDSITVNPVQNTEGNGQNVEYAINLTDDLTGVRLNGIGWQTETTFSGLNSGTAYYVYARTAETDVYKAGTAQVSNVISTLPAPTWVVTVESVGTGYSGGGSYAQGTIVSIEAGTPQEGMQFKNWTTTPEVTFTAGASETDSTSKFIMPDRDVTVAAVFETIPVTIDNVEVLPSSVEVLKGSTYQFRAVVSGTNLPQSVTWEVEGGNGATEIASDGTLTVAANETAPTLTVIATSTIDESKYGTATVTVMNDVPFFVAVNDITNVPSTTRAGTSLILTGTVNPANATNKTIVWSVKNQGSTGAEISANVLNTTAEGIVTIMATIANGAVAGDYKKDFNITVTAGMVVVDPGLDPEFEPVLISIAGLSFKTNGNCVPSDEMESITNDGKGNFLVTLYGETSPLSICRVGYIIENVPFVEMIEVVIEKNSVDIFSDNAIEEAEYPGWYFNIMESTLNHGDRIIYKFYVDEAFIGTFTVVYVNETEMILLEVEQTKLNGNYFFAPVELAGPDYNYEIIRSPSTLGGIAQMISTDGKFRFGSSVIMPANYSRAGEYIVRATDNDDNIINVYRIIVSEPD